MKPLLQLPAPRTFPKWNSLNPAKSLRVIATVLHAEARKTLLLEGMHRERIYLIPLNGKGLMREPGDGSRKGLRERVNDYVTKHNVFGMVHIGEIFSDDKHAGKAQKTEHKDFVVEAQSVDGWFTTWTDKVVRDKTGRVKLKKSIKVGGTKRPWKRFR